MFPWLKLGRKAKDELQDFPPSPITNPFLTSMRGETLVLAAPFVCPHQKQRIFMGLQRLLPRGGVCISKALKSRELLAGRIAPALTLLLGCL